MPADEAFIGSVRRYANHLRQEGLVDSLFIDGLLETAVDDVSASRVLDALKEAHARALGAERVSAVRQTAARRHKDAGWDNMVWGGLLCLGGLAVNAALFVSAGAHGAHLILIGAPIYGAVRFFSGLAQHLDEARCTRLD